MIYICTVQPSKPNIVHFLYPQCILYDVSLAGVYLEFSLRSWGGVEDVNNKSELVLHSFEASSSVTSTDLTDVWEEYEF